MSSDPISPWEGIQIDGYVPVVIIAALGYDYILTISREIDYVWLRPWTWVSTLFVVIRYVGLCWAIMLSLIDSAFIPGPIKTYVLHLDNQCNVNSWVGVSAFFDRIRNRMRSGYLLEGAVMFAIGDWAYMLFLAAADLMILRVYALWNQSRTIFGILLFIYVPQIMVSVVWEVVYYNPKTTLSVSVVQVLHSKYCNYSSNVATPSMAYRAVPRFVFGIALLILAVIPTLRESVGMYRLTKRWKTNRSMKLLVREGAVYFIVNLLFNIVNLIQLQSADLMLFLDGVGYALTCAIMPRFIISIRELYDRDLWNRWRGIDTGFRAFPQPIGSVGVGVSSINFAEDFLEEEQDETDDSTAIGLELSDIA